MYKNFFKRLLDIFLSLLALTVLSPFLIVVIILTRIFIGSPVFFKQKRPGMNGKVFTIYKFRTMNDKRDEAGELLPDSERITKFGKFLRSFSIDELPELVNIVKGDMSIIGPRPLLIEYLDIYTDEEKRRHDVRPGLSGLAQIKGRNEIDLKEKIVWDVEYVDNVSFWLDAKIVLLTIFKVLRREGIDVKKSDNKDGKCKNV